MNWPIAIVLPLEVTRTFGAKSESGSNFLVAWAFRRNLIMRDASNHNANPRCCAWSLNGQIGNTSPEFVLLVTIELGATVSEALLPVLVEIADELSKTELEANRGFRIK